VNDHHRIDPSLPWADERKAGWARETGSKLPQYTQTKSVIVNLDDTRSTGMRPTIVRLS